MKYYFILIRNYKFLKHDSVIKKQRKVEDNEGTINSLATLTHSWATDMPGVAMWERWLLPRTEGKVR